MVFRGNENLNKKKGEKTVKIKINTVMSAIQVIARISGERHSIKFAYRIKRIYDKLLSEAKRIDGLRKKMQERYGATTKEDGSVSIPPDKMSDAEKEWTEFCETEVEVELECLVLPMSMLDRETELAARQPNIQAIAISASDLISLGPIFEDDDPQMGTDKEFGDHQPAAKDAGDEALRPSEKKGGKP